MFQSDRSILVSIRHPVPVRLPDKQGRPAFGYVTLLTPCAIPSVPKTALSRLWRTGASPFGHKFEEGRWDYYHGPVIPAIQQGLEIERIKLTFLTDALLGVADGEGGFGWHEREFRRTPLWGDSWYPLVEPWHPGVRLSPKPDAELARRAVLEVQAYCSRHLRHDGKGLLRLNRPVQLHMEGRDLVSRRMMNGVPDAGAPGLRLGAEEIRLRAFYEFLRQTARWGAVEMGRGLPRRPRTNHGWDLDVEEYVNAAPAFVVRSMARAALKSGSRFFDHRVYDMLEPLLVPGLVRCVPREAWPRAIATISDAAFEAASVLPEGKLREDARMVGLYGRMVAAPSFPENLPPDEDIAALAGIEPSIERIQ